MDVLDLRTAKENVVYFAQQDCLAASQSSNVLLLVEENVVRQLVMKDANLGNVDVELVLGVTSLPQVQQDEEVGVFGDNRVVGGELRGRLRLGTAPVGTNLMKVADSMHFDAILVDGVPDGALLPHDNYITVCMFQFETV